MHTLRTHTLTHLGTHRDVPHTHTHTHTHTYTHSHTHRLHPNDRLSIGQTQTLLSPPTLLFTMHNFVAVTFISISHLPACLSSCDEKNSISIMCMCLNTGVLSLAWRSSMRSIIVASLMSWRNEWLGESLPAHVSSKVGKEGPIDPYLQYEKIGLHQQSFKLVEAECLP